MAVLFATTTTDGKPIGFKTVRGTLWEDEFIVVDQSTGDPVNLTGIKGIVMRARERVDAPEVVMELSTDNERLVVLDAVAGRVGITVNSAESVTEFPAADFRKKRYVTDALIVREGDDGDEYEPAISGRITVYPQITRANEP